MSSPTTPETPSLTSLLAELLSGIESNPGKPLDLDHHLCEWAKTSSLTIISGGVTRLDSHPDRYEAERLMHFFDVCLDGARDGSDGTHPHYGTTLKVHFELSQPNQSNSFDTDSSEPPDSDYLNIISSEDQLSLIKLLRSLLPKLESLSIVVLDRVPLECQLLLLQSWPQSLRSLRIVHPLRTHYFQWSNALLQRSLRSLTSLTSLGVNYQLNSLLFAPVKDLATLMPVLLSLPLLDTLSITCHDYCSLLYLVHHLALIEDGGRSGRNSLLEVNLCEVTFNSYSVIRDPLLIPLWIKVGKLHGTCAPFPIEKSILKNWASLTRLDLSKADSSSKSSLLSNNNRVKPQSALRGSSRLINASPPAVKSLKPRCSDNLRNLSALPALAELCITDPDLTYADLDHLPVFGSLKTLTLSDMTIDVHHLLAKLWPVMPVGERIELRYSAAMLAQDIHLNRRKNLNSFLENRCSVESMGCSFLCKLCAKQSLQLLHLHGQSLLSVVWQSCTMAEVNDSMVQLDQCNEYIDNNNTTINNGNRQMVVKAICRDDQ